MAIVNGPEYNRVKNLPHDNGNGIFYEMTGIPVNKAADLISRPAAAGQVEENPKSKPSPIGHLQATEGNLTNKDPDIRRANQKVLKALYIRLAAATYSGEKVEPRLQTFHSSNIVAEQFMIELRKQEDWKEDPEHWLELYLGDSREACGVFLPPAGCFIPAPGFRDTTICGQDPDAFLDDNPHIRKLYRAILTTLVNNGADQKLFRELLTAEGGPSPQAQLDLYQADKKVRLNPAIDTYICTTSKVREAAAVCGYMGTNTQDYLLDTVTLIHAGSGAVTGLGMKTIGSDFVAIPPVKNAVHVTGSVYMTGGCSNCMGIVLPGWIEYSAEVNGILCHKIYTIPAGGWKIKRPKNYLDLAHKIPDGVLKKYNYLVNDPSGIPSISMDELDCHWKVYPEDTSTRVVELESKQYDGTWEIHQRDTRIEAMELLDEEDNLLGMVFPEKAPFFRKNTGNTMYVAFDPAGAVSVRLASVAFSRSSKDIHYTDMVCPLNPMTMEEIRSILESCTVSMDGQGTHFDSLLQTFFPTGEGSISGWSRLMVESRVWKPGQKKLFENLKDFQGTMLAAMSALGVYSNPKEMIARSLRPSERIACLNALEMFIGTMILEAVMALSRDGYSTGTRNLEFLISYPKNGSGEGVTKMMQQAIRGGVAFVNDYLTPENQLVIWEGKTMGNVTMWSESEATAEWHLTNPPANESMGGEMIAVTTPDIGHSTHDCSLRVNGHLYMFSLPYAAQQITNATLAKVYGGNVSSLLTCFTDGNPELMRGALVAMKTAVASNQGKLYERLGFILSLNQLFNSCTFNVNGVRADAYQVQVQEMTEAKLNVAIPAYADLIVKAIRNEDLDDDSDVLLAPVGKGSLAINNTAEGYEERFVERLKAEVSYLLGTEFTGEIRLLPNNDTDKVSVAQGLIDLKENGGPARKFDPVIASETEVTEHYLDLVYGQDVQAKQKFTDTLEAMNRRSTSADYNAMREKLYDNAFRALMKNYTYEDFEQSFNRFGYIGMGDGSFDGNIRDMAQRNFKPLVGEVLGTRKALIMACPGMEKEMICGAMMDLIMEKLEV